MTTLNTLEDTHNSSKEDWSLSIHNEIMTKSVFSNFITMNHEPTKVAGDMAENDTMIDIVRHGVLISGDMSEQRVAFDLRNQAREALVDWATARLEAHIIDAVYNDIEFLEADSLNPETITKAKQKLTVPGLTIKLDEGHEEVAIMFVHPETLKSLPPATNITILGVSCKRILNNVIVFTNNLVDPNKPFILAPNVIEYTDGAPLEYIEDLDDYGQENGFGIISYRSLKLNKKNAIGIKIK